MFYYYFRIFNWLCSLFGLKKPFLLVSGQPDKVTPLNKLWSLVVIGTFLFADYMSINVTTDIGIKRNLQEISDTNDLVINILIIFINLLEGEKACVELYEIFNNIFNRFGLKDKTLKMIALKFYIWFTIPTVIFIVSILMEILMVHSPQFILLTRVPCFLSILHLAVHLHLMLAVLRLLNSKLTNIKGFNSKPYKNSKEARQTSKLLKMLQYFLELDINFLDTDDQDLSPIFLCKVYDDLGTCIKLLEKYHGKQILLTIWMMFSSAVIGATLVSCEETKNPWIVVTRGVLPFSWFALCCFVDDKLRKEVEWTEILIMKHLIDFRCDLPRKNALEIFKQIVGTNNLEFTAGNLFHLNYAMILGTVMNVITYSIILVQLFISTD